MCDELNDIPGPVHEHRAFEARRRWRTRTYPSGPASLRFLLGTVTVAQFLRKETSIARMGRGA